MFSFSGFCLKTHTSSGEKVFVNVCRSPDIPSPPDLTNQELECLIESENASTFRIPMSLGEPHAEVDKGKLSALERRRQWAVGREGAPSGDLGIATYLCTLG